MLALLALVLLVGISCQQKVDIDKEKEAILAVINDEKAGYMNRDMEQWSKHILQDSTFSWLYATSGWCHLSRGFSQHSDLVKEWWADTTIVNQKFEVEIMELKIFPESAWTLLKATWHYEDEGEPAQSVGIETIYFEKAEGEWKIASHTVIDTTSYEETAEKEEVEE